MARQAYTNNNITQVWLIPDKSRFFYTRYRYQHDFLISISVKIQGHTDISIGSDIAFIGIGIGIINYII